MELDRYWPEIGNTYSFVKANRVAYSLQMISTGIPLIVTYLIWRAAYAQAEIIGGLTRDQMVTYLFVAYFFQIVSSFNLEGNMANDIREGTIIRDMVKPRAFVLQQFFVTIGWLSGVALFSAFPLLISGILFFGVALPAPGALPFLAVSLILALVINFCLTFLTGVAAFWLGSIWGLSLSKQMLVSFAGGAMVPLYLFPDWLRRVADLLPFQAAVHTPTALYLGRLAGWDALRAVGVQALWAGGLMALAHWLWHRGVRYVTIQGG